MTTIIELAKEAGYDETSETIPSFHQFIERFAALVRAEALEEAAEKFEDMQRDGDVWVTTVAAAAAIRGLK